MSKLYGSACVNTRDQNEDGQLIALDEVGVGVQSGNIYMDMHSGKAFERPMYAYVNIPISGRGIRKSPVIVKRTFLQEHIRFRFCI